jgi:hypothetical protein
MLKQYERQCGHFCVMKMGQCMQETEAVFASFSIKKVNTETLQIFFKKVFPN